MRLRLPRTTTYDVPLVVVVLMLLLLGLAMVYSASGITALDANDDPSTYLAQQSAWAVLGLAALVVALVRRSRTDLILASFVLVYFVDLLTIRAHFDRYTLPLVPPLAALASRFRALTPVTLLLLVVPLTWSVRDTKELTRTDTRVIAAQWVREHLAPGTEIAADPSTPPNRFP